MDWSDQLDRLNTNTEKWFDPGSNMMLDFHGDPRTGIGSLNFSGPMK